MGLANGSRWRYHASSARFRIRLFRPKSV
jgi:hypothetical protein